MIKTILVPASGTPTDAATFAAALAIARPFGAHIDVLHARLDPTGAAVAMASDAGSGALTAGLLEQLENDARDREAKAKEAFTRFCGEAGIAEAGAPPAGSQSSGGGVSAEWHVESGDEPRWMAQYGMTADLVVAGRTPEEDVLGRTMLETVLLETGRPLLIPGTAAMPAAIERIAIAWKATQHTARAVAMAMPLVARAREVVVLTVAERPDEHAATDRLVRAFGWHGLAARVEPLQPGADGAVATLLARANERADLLVMGGYGHSRVREWVFGGFTQQILQAAPLPVLIAH
jgi:nucleotide-binding universal stress UspA family protein